MKYEDFVQSKLFSLPPVGFDPDAVGVSPSLFPFQADIVRWAVRRGRAAIFASTGLGKTRMQIEWAVHVRENAKGDVLILAPLAVAAQTVAEAAGMGVKIHHVRDGSEVQPGINITNYDRLHRFDCGRFAGVVLDESSIIKHHTSKTLKLLLDAFAGTPYRLCATATPSPNDYVELGTHAEFLGVCSQTEMLAEYFCHDGGETQTWRLKGHARGIFWKWVASWAALVRSPADLGYDGSAYELPELSVSQHVIAADHSTAKEVGMLFAEEAKSLTERRNARRASLSARVKECADLVNADKQAWIVWCDLNDEGDALTESIDGAVQIAGADDSDDKEARLEAFARGEIRVLVSKPRICGFGLNWQHCARMAFVGVTDSWEAYHQAVRRCYRFGQKRPVDVHIFASELEGSVLRNLERKQADADKMAIELSAETKDAVASQVKGGIRTTNEYVAKRKIIVPEWLKEEREAS